MPSSTNTITNHIKSSLKFLRKNWLVLMVVILASWVRTYQLETKGILFGDAGRDLLAAKTAVENGSLPLLGIASSIPRFHQGPISLWLAMVVYYLAGQRTLVFSLVFAFTGILAVIALYELVVVNLGRRSAILATLLLAFSPLAIAHSRMPYHTTLIPVATVLFLASLLRLWRKQRWGVLISVFAWGVLMQLELSLFALGLIIPWVWWRQSRKISFKLISQTSAAGLIAFSPQLIYDFTHPAKPSQLIGFTAWVGYRVVSAVGLIGEHQLSSRRLVDVLELFREYFNRFFGVENPIISLIFLSLLIICVVLVMKNRSQLPVLIKITAMAVALLTVSYLVHGSPSEAYFPAYLPFLSILLGWALNQLFKQNSPTLILLSAAWVVMNLAAINKANFFVSQQQSFSYKASTQEQRLILVRIAHISHNDFQLKTTQPGGKFPSYFDNFRWLAAEMGLAENPDGMVFYVESKNSGLSGYPGIIKLEFESLDVYY